MIVPIDNVTLRNYNCFDQLNEFVPDCEPTYDAILLLHMQTCVISDEPTSLHTYTAMADARVRYSAIC